MGSRSVRPECSDPENFPEPRGHNRAKSQTAQPIRDAPEPSRRQLSSLAPCAFTMSSLRGVSRSARALPLSPLSRQASPACVQQRRCNSSAAAAELQELEGNSTLGVPQLSPEEKSQFRPWKRAKDRQLNLPGSRYGQPFLHLPIYTRTSLS